MKKHYHFIGIGGIGMSALARILLQKGEKVTGSDVSESLLLRQLEQEGASIRLGHSPDHIQNPAYPDCIVYSTDIPQNNPEYHFAIEKQLPLLHRSELLAEVMEGYAPLLVTGTHGKTTTTSMLASVLIEAGLDPSFAVGGILQATGTNGRFGRGVYFVAEADESDGSFLSYPSFGAIITNLGLDHMNYWKTEEALFNGFSEFANQVGSSDHLFWCKDEMRLNALNLEGYSYGFHEKADLTIDNFHQVQWHMVFDLSFEGKHYRSVEIPLIGAHNVLNAAAVFGLALKLDVDEQVLRKGLLNFKGVGRRVEKKGSVQGIDIYDDYAHHPTEIFATLRALKTAIHRRRLVVVFQPHRFTRTKHCMDDFADAFEFVDELILTDIYAAREKPIPGVSSLGVLKAMEDRGFKRVSFVEKDELTHFLQQFLKKGDVLVTMGAGDINLLGPKLLDVLHDDEQKAL